MLALQTPGAARGQVLNAGGGHEPTTVNHLLTLVARQSGTSPEPAHDCRGTVTSDTRMPTSLALAG
jgi:nucleoside-diphosphate-sugar epimerase